MKTRITGVFLCFVMLLSFLPSGAFAADGFTDTFGGETYAVSRGTYFAYGGLYSSSAAYLPYYYSDGYFTQDFTVRDPHLATMSLNLAIAATYSGGVETPYCHSVVRQMLAEIGCAEERIFVNDMALKTPTANSIAYALGSKELKLHTGDYVLLPIAVRGGGYESEWIGNFTLGASGESEGFRIAADAVCAGIADYLDRWELAEAAQNGKLIFWPVGYSRGGAVANLVAKRLVDDYGTACVCCYTFEAPMGGIGENSSAYGCIHNYVNYADLVPLVAPSKMGFFRYGEDCIFPLGRESSSDYAAELTAMKAQLSSIDPSYAFDDTFQLKYLDIGGLSGLLGLITKVISGDDIFSTAGYSSPGGNKLTGDYMRILIQQIQTWSITSRAKYAAGSVTLNKKSYMGIEDAVKSVGGVFFCMSAAKRDLFLSRLSNISIEASDASSVLDILNNWNSTGLFGMSDKTRESYINTYWSKLVATGALNSDIVSAEEYAVIEAAWPTLACTLLPFVCSDNNTRASSYGFKNVSHSLVLTATLLENVNCIQQNHEYWPNLAWVRSYDSYYTENGIPAASTRPYSSTPAPAAYIGERTVSSVSGSYTPLCCGDALLLDAAARTGETIFYDIYDLTHSRAVETGTLYYGSVALPDSGGEETDYRITARAYCHGMISGSAVYYVRSVPSLIISSAELTQNGIGYVFESNFISADKVVLAAAAYEGGKLVSAKFSAPIALSNRTNSGMLPITVSEGRTYRLFLMAENGFAPLCPCWYSEANNI